MELFLVQLLRLSLLRERVREESLYGLFVVVQNVLVLCAQLLEPCSHQQGVQPMQGFPVLHKRHKSSGFFFSRLLCLNPPSSDGLQQRHFDFDLVHHEVLEVLWLQQLSEVPIEGTELLLCHLLLLLQPEVE